MNEHSFRERNYNISSLHPGSINVNSQRKEFDPVAVQILYLKRRIYIEKAYLSIGANSHKSCSPL